MFSEKLLPADIEARRLSAHFVRLPVKGYPPDTITPALAGDGQCAEFNHYTLPDRDLIATVPGPGKLAIYRKRAPHCRYGFMLVSFETRFETSLTDFCREMRASYWNTAAQFGEYCSEIGLTPNVSFTYDPKTLDRKSGQSQKWFHMHLNSRTPEAMMIIENSRKPLSTESSEIKRRALVEEFSILGSMILFDWLTTEGNISPSELRDVFEADGLPNLAVVIDGDWNILKSPKFDHTLITLHNASTILTAKLNEAFFEGSNNLWERPVIKKGKIEDGIKKFPWLRNKSIEALRCFLNNLRPELLNGKFLERFIRQPNSPMTSYLYPLVCPNYAITITRENGKMVLSMRPQMFSDTGAAGLYYVNRTTVKLGRGSETYTPSEMIEKGDFELEFGKRVNTFN